MHGLRIGFLAMLLLPGYALADVADSTALQVDGDHARFTIDVNGIPIGLVGGRALAGAAFFIDDKLRRGENVVTVRTDLDRPYGTVQLTLSAPAGEGAIAGPVLAHVQCGFAQPDGTTPACKPHDVFRMTFRRNDTPDYRLWHAQPAALSAPAIAASLATVQAELTQAADRRDWRTLFYGAAPRSQDLLAAGQAEASVFAQMSHDMDVAAAAHPGVEAALPPAASALVLTSLADNLVAASRRDGAPVLRVRVGASDGQDPEDFGDYADRFLGGVYQTPTAIFGSYDGVWTRVR